ncbi:hypothetical protein BT63DRAFT_420843 [Microthyrium microscopicum]|uniref:Extracellular mutant protein 11 C-terminal domain-containing protein n=1 Tax=Microthyrium microscopicum TaxID=703497 RepID=A0A6A6UK48_9PEZI|nr:hypothetical protein BT63DRAFT_420843 [Microthyrium microscopicum]
MDVNHYVSENIKPSETSDRTSNQQHRREVQHLKVGRGDRRAHLSQGPNTSRTVQQPHKAVAKQTQGNNQPAPIDSAATMTSEELNQIIQSAPGMSINPNLYKNSDNHGQSRHQAQYPHGHSYEAEVYAAQQPPNGKTRHAIRDLGALETATGIKYGGVEDLQATKYDGEEDEVEGEGEDEDESESEDEDGQDGAFHVADDQEEFDDGSDAEPRTVVLALDPESPLQQRQQAGFIPPKHVSAQHFSNPTSQNPVREVRTATGGQRQSANPQYAQHHAQNARAESQRQTQQAIDNGALRSNSPAFAMHGGPPYQGQESPRHPKQAPKPAVNRGPADNHVAGEKRGHRVAFTEKSQMINGSGLDPVEAAEINLDYSLEELKDLNYSDLNNQDFDVDPKATRATERVEGDALKHQLEKGLALSDDKKKQFFNSLTIDQWDESGDWFLEQYGGLLQKMREARKAKRDLAQKFEKQVAERQDAVEARKGGIMNVLGEMKKSGQVVLKAQPNHGNKTE